MTANLVLPTQRLIYGLHGRLVFGLLVLFAVVVFIYSMSRRVRVLLAGAPENRFDRIGLRLRKTFEYALLQKRMFRDPYAGFFHILLFSGFVVLSVPTLAPVAAGWIPGSRLLAGR